MSLSEIAGGLGSEKTCSETLKGLLSPILGLVW